MTNHGKHDDSERGIGRRGFLSGVLGIGGLSMAGLSGAAVTDESESHWPHSRKYGFATAYDHDRAMPDLPKVWYTLTKGAITGIRYPRLDLINTTAVEFLVTDGDGYAARTYNVDRTDDGTAEDPLTRHAAMVEDDALVFEQTLTDGVNADHDWQLTVEYAAATESDALLADVTFDASSEYDLFVMGEFALGHGLPDNTASVAGSGDAKRIVGSGSTGGWITQPDGDSYDVAAALTADGGFDWATVDAAGGSVADLLSGTVPGENDSASGTVHVAGRLLSGGGSTTMAMGFARGGDTGAATTAAQDALARGYGTVRSSYVEGWRSYVDFVDTPDSVRGDPKLRAHYDASVMALKAGESKHAQFRGASVAAPSFPWGQTRTASSAAQTGYSHCWPRDLYHVYTTLEAIGDVEGAIDATEYLYEYHQQSDGSVKQSTAFDGKDRWGAVQMDQVAYPLIMAAQLAERHGIDPGDQRVGYDYADVRRGAEYIVTNGPDTDQERWEENRGYSPHAIGAQISGLVCAAALAEARGESGDAQSWRDTAEQWNRDLETWTVSTGGPFSDGFDFEEYFVRVSPEGEVDADWASVYIKNRVNESNFPVNEIVDPSFLELVRLGVRPHDDTVVENSVTVVDDQLRVDTPNGPGWYRYNKDGYGQKWNGDGFFAEGEAPYKGNIGRLWPFLTGERGEYELLAGGSGDLAPRRLLETMADFANEGRMLSEQVWDRTEPTEFDWEFGEGTGAATPLLWCHAQYARLAHCLDAGEPVETPVAAREFFGIEFPSEQLSASLSDPGSVPVGSETTVDVVLDGADTGVAGFDLSVSTADASVATITDVDTPADGLTRTSVTGGGASGEAMAVQQTSLGSGRLAVATVTVRGESAGQVSLSLSVDAVGDPDGNSYAIGTVDGVDLSVGSGPDPVVGTAAPRDPDGDGDYEDVNGDGTTDIADVQAFFDNFQAEDDLDAFDFDGDGGLDLSDVIALLDEL